MELINTAEIAGATNKQFQYSEILVRFLQFPLTMVL